jgi:hypothetical protein
MRFRSVRLASLAVVTLLLGSTFAQAGIVASATLIKDPSAGAPFGPPAGDAAMPAPWVSYRLSLSATGTDTIQAVDVAIAGNLNQKWSSSNLDGVYDTPSPNSTSLTNADSHLLAAANALIGAPPTEDNTLAGSPMSASNNDTTGWGIGHALTGAWSVNGAAVTELNLAYIVVQKGDIPNMVISVKSADPSGSIFPTLTLNDFFPQGPVNTPPTVVDGLINNVKANDLNPANNPVTFTFTATDDQPTSQLTWSGFGFDSFTQGFGGPAAGAPGVAATFDPLTQKFSWLTNGTPRGSFKWHVTATNAAGSDQGFLTVNVTGVPEPATLTLVGLAALCMVGVARRRS